jgi:hypothetical protein
VGKVVVGAAFKVLVEVDDNSVQIVGDPKAILGQQVRPYPIHTINNIILYLLIV